MNVENPYQTACSRKPRLNEHSLISIHFQADMITLLRTAFRASATSSTPGTSAFHTYHLENAKKKSLYADALTFFLRVYW